MRKKASIFDAGFLLWRLRNYQIFYVLTGYMSNNGAALMTQATNKE